MKRKISRRKIVGAVLALLASLGVILMIGAEGAGVNNELDAAGVAERGLTGIALLFGSMLVANWLEVWN